MKKTRILLCVAAMLAMGLPRNLPAAAGQYDPPDFDHSIFEVDGLSMSPGDREQTVEALAALARNFPEDSRVDADLKEKALAIALRLDPLNPRAREAHSTLSEGNSPGNTDLFESLSAISEALWQQAARLAKPKGEPDDALLAPYLMELSLLAHPDPPTERLRRFASLVLATPPAWKKVVTLQPAENDSTLRSRELARASEPPQPVTTPAKEPPAGSAPEAAVGETAEIQLPQTEIGFVACESPDSAAAGIARLSIRKPDPAESTLFGIFVTEGNLENLEMKVAPPRTGTPIRGSEIIESTVRKSFPIWPKNKIGELSFSPENGEPPEELSMSLVGSLLLESAFSGQEIASDFVVAGVLDDTSNPSLGAPDPALTAIVKSAASLQDRPFLLLPTTVNIVPLAMGDPEDLLKLQLIGFESYNELRSLVQEDKRSSNLKEAAVKFASIVDLRDRMTMEKILRNTVVKGRLEEILSLWPNHLSAKAILARLSGDFSDSPDSASDNPGGPDKKSPEMKTAPGSSDGKLSATESNAQIHEALAPLHNFATDDSAALDEGAQLARQAADALVALKPRIDASSQNVLLAAQRIVKGFENLVVVKPRGSSVWNQRLNDLRGVASSYNLEQAALGSEHSFDF